ncbi:MAG TPA: cupin domain-containing protein [Gammaproteobacteria bacterium]|nr:cupin domain-containing protein [Gammaproteobacteria bacterium]
MRAAIRRYDPNTEFFIDEGCYITELSNTGDDPDVSIARARVPPGVRTRWHRLEATVERYVVLEGTGTVEVSGLEPSSVGPGDVVLIPPDAAQRIRNDGTDDLVFLAVCSPRFRPEVYRDSVR